MHVPSAMKVVVTGHIVIMIAMGLIGAGVIIVVASVMPSWPRIAAVRAVSTTMAAVVGLIVPLAVRRAAVRRAAVGRSDMAVLSTRH
jgi:uncharacterized membrane protein